MAKAVLITGSNLGDTTAHMAAARDQIARTVGPILACSALWESDPWELEAPQRFLNQVLVVETDLTPQQLLTTVETIERSMGRRHKGETAPDGHRLYHSRTMDIDLLFYDDLVLDTPTLTLPHPRIQERAFVLGPLQEVIPRYVHPLLHQTIETLWNNLQENTTRS